MCQLRIHSQRPPAGLWREVPSQSRFCGEVSVMRDGAGHVVEAAQVSCPWPPFGVWSSPFTDCRSDGLIEHDGLAEESPGRMAPGCPLGLITLLHSMSQHPFFFF